MKILMSIKPNFVKEIVEGRKLFEYRKVIYKKQDIDKIVVYSSSPVCRVIGEFSVENILCESPDVLWGQTSANSGVSKEFFDKYFEGRDKGYAIQISSFQLYPSPKTLEEAYPGTVPPQSFCYIKD